MIEPLKTLVLGCGPRGWRPEALNIDAQPTRADQPLIPNFLLWDFVKDGIPLDHAPYETIVAEDVIEHISAFDLPRVLQNIFDRLVPGGLLIVKCPNLETIFREYASCRIGGEELARLIYGEQHGSIHDVHKVGFTIDTLRRTLTRHNFVIDRIEPRVKDELGRSNNMRFTAHRP